MRGMLLQILVEGHRFLNDLLVNHRCIKQVQTVLLPYGKPQVGNVQSLLLAGDGNDVAIVDSLTQGFRAAAQRTLRNIARPGTRESLLLLANDRHQFGLCLQRLIGCGVCAHIVHADALDSRKGRIGRLYLADNLHGLLVGNPVGEVVQPRGVVRQDALAIAQRSERLQIVVP